MIVKGCPSKLTDRPRKSSFVLPSCPKSDQPIGIWIGQWLQQHGMHRAKDRHVGADSKGQRDDRDQRKGRRSQEGPAGESYILPESVHLSYDPESRCQPELTQLPLRRTKISVPRPARL